MSVDVVYSAATGRIRRIVIPSGGAVHAGETVLAVSDAQYNAIADLNTLQTLVNTTTSKTPSGDRYVSVDESKNVLGVYIADPACGDVAPLPSASLVVHATANRGDLLWGNQVLPNTPLGSHENKIVFRNTFRNTPLP